jgi:hypothetical protein
MSKTPETINIEEIKNLLETLSFTSAEDLELLEKLNSLVEATIEATKLIVDQSNKN